MPGFVRELVRHLESDEVAQEISLAGALGARIACLPAPARTLLDVLAVAERPLTRDEASAGGGEPASERAVRALSDAGLIENRGVLPEHALALYHERIRTIALQALSPARRDELRARLRNRVERPTVHEGDEGRTRSRGRSEPCRLKD